MTKQSNPGPRLDDRVIILTGAAGSIGGAISRFLLREGGRVMMTERDEALLARHAAALEAEGISPAAFRTVVADPADPEAARRTVAETVEGFGRVDGLVNNAGTAGPKRTLNHISFTEAEAASGDDGSREETMLDAAMTLLGGPWNMARAAVPHLSVGASIVNVSTIFSRTAFYGRIPYVVPTSGLNALSLGLARELGRSDKGIRVNTVFPGPIESEDIDAVFADMDNLQGYKEGHTSQFFRELMITARGDEDGGVTLRYAKPEDVAATILWLSTTESAAFSGHAFEVTNGMQVPAQSRSKLVSWPDNRLVDLRDRVVLVLGGSDVDEAFVFAERNAGRGAQVVVAFRSLEGVAEARFRVQSRGLGPFRLLHLDPLRKETAERAFQFVRDHYGRLDGVIVLPHTANGEYGHNLSTAGDAEVKSFIQNEVVAPVALAASLSKELERWAELKDAPAITYVTNPDDGHDNRLNDVNRAAVEELIRVWRYEDQHADREVKRPWSCLPNQIVRYDNAEPDNLTFAADWTSTLTNRVRKMDPINLWVPKQIKRATGKSSMPMSIQRVLPGLHKNRTAVITGGSLGIGMQLGRYLALAGARVLLSARSEKKLAAARDAIVEELTAVGYAAPDERVFILPGIDVGQEDKLHDLFEHSMSLFGSVDFLINNAGISGAEEMVVDMTLDQWNRTMETNLISNYSLIRKFTPLMKERGRGNILNVSSYFGGEKYVAVAYPNRADYAVSKAGQRSLAEILSRHLGPEVQINALAPGPVDGARLRGMSGSPGLFARRGLLILENKRLNLVHGAVLAALAEGLAVGPCLLALAANEVPKVEDWEGGAAPAAIGKLLSQVSHGRGPVSSKFILSRMGAEKLVRRLRHGGVITEAEGRAFLDAFVDAPDPFFDERAVSKAADKIEAGIISRLHLHTMPTDEQVGLSTTFALADEIVSGETFHPSGGLKFERSVTEGELMLRPGKEELAGLAGRHAVVLGDAMQKELRALGEGFLHHGVASLTVLTRSQEAADELTRYLRGEGEQAVHVDVVGDDIEAGLEAAAARLGQVDIVVSTPYERLPLNALSAESVGPWERVLSRDDFADLVRDHLTHHFRIASRAALRPGCQIVLVTPDTSRASTREEFALALFIKTSLHAFTVTLGVEGERLPTYPAVNQVQLTRRARAEEPGTDQEVLEEMERFVYAVLQCSVPAPKPSESRYLARIFRGNAVTV